MTDCWKGRTVAETEAWDLQRMTCLHWGVVFVAWQQLS